MSSHNRHLTLIRAGLLAAVLTAGGALVAYASLPPAADGGQAHAAAKGDNGAQGTQGADENATDGTTTATEKLSDNWDRLSATLNDVLSRLQNGKASDAAVNALQDVIDRLSGDIGLHKATDAVSGDHGDSSLPDVVTNHPGQP